MYRGFNLDLVWDYKNYKDYFIEGLVLNEVNNIYIRDTLDKFLLADGSLDGNSMQSNWFPKIKSDIFISHSHCDKKMAIALSCWMEKELGINAFVDSCIWGYANDLLKMIDNEYCLNYKDNYDYNKRNYSTSHVHMMLSTALAMMIDNTECLFFLNTPNSISTSEVVSKTESPWIYSEIAISQIIRSKIPQRISLADSKYFAKSGARHESVIVKYEADLSYLVHIDGDILNKWNNNGNYKNAHQALDALYKLKPLPRLDLIED